MRKKTPDKVAIIDQERRGEWIGGRVPVLAKKTARGEVSKIPLLGEKRARNGARGLLRAKIVATDLGEHRERRQTRGMAV
jgi:hypothetical protein